MGQIDNRMVVDSEWESMEREEIPRGQFDRWGGFVHEEYLMEVATENVLNDSVTRESFLEKVLDYIENDKEAAERFLKWFYPDYGKEQD